MRQYRFAALVAVFACCPAFAADPVSYQEQGRCVAVLKISAELFEVDGSIPELTDSTKVLAKRMSDAFLFNTPYDRMAEASDAEQAEEDRLVDMWNDATEDAAQMSVLDYLATQIQTCKALLPPE